MTGITYDDVIKAQHQIAPYIRRTPFIRFDYLSEKLNKEIWLKCENLQRTGSFKIRGAAASVLNQMTQAKKASVVAASAGNHAQGVAAICHILGIQATIVMPKTTPLLKVQNTQSWGAKIVLEGQSYQEAYEAATRLTEELKAVFVHAFDNDWTMAGQGTVGLELLEDPAFEAIQSIVVPVGGGGLATGIATALKAKRPELKVYGVGAANAPGVYQSYKTGKLIAVPVAPSLAEGVATKTTTERVLPILKERLDDMFTVTEETIANAISLLVEQGKLVGEGAGVLGIAALLDGKIPEERVALIISGGNCDVMSLAHLLQRGLTHQGRLARLLFSLVDRPGSLCAVVECLAAHSANIVEIRHQRRSMLTPLGGTDVEIDIETKGFEHTDTIFLDLKQRGFHVQKMV